MGPPRTSYPPVNEHSWLENPPFEDVCFSIGNGGFSLPCKFTGGSLKLTYYVKVPEDWCLGAYFPFRKAYLQGRFVSFREGIFPTLNFPLGVFIGSWCFVIATCNLNLKFREGDV